MAVPIQQARSQTQRCFSFPKQWVLINISPNAHALVPTRSAELAMNFERFLGTMVSFETGNLWFRNCLKKYQGMLALRLLQHYDRISWTSHAASKCAPMGIVSVTSLRNIEDSALVSHPCYRSSLVGDARACALASRGGQSLRPL